MPDEVSVFRLNLLRCMYLLNAVLVGSGVVAAFVQREGPWGAVPGVAFSFWAALATLSLLGIRYPLAMLPIIFMQLFYKTFWLLAVYIPLRATGRSSEMLYGFLVGILLDVAVIPWAYASAHYLKRPADRWRSASAPS
jgi:hypothetical protein